MFPVPKSFFLTSGVGVHRERLTTFELALRDADIEQQNLVSVSSILPPGCEQVEPESGVGTLRPGEITFCVFSLGGFSGRFGGYGYGYGHGGVGVIGIIDRPCCTGSHGAALI